MSTAELVTPEPAPTVTAPPQTQPTRPLAGAEAGLEATQPARDSVSQTTPVQSTVVTSGERPSAPGVWPHVLHADVGQGFELESEDGNQSLRIGGLLSGRATLVAPTDDDASIAASIRLARIMLRGRLLGSNLMYLFQGEFAGNPRLLDLELDYAFADQWLLRFGRVRVPFGRQWITGLNALMFPDRSVVSDTFRPGRDTGATLESRLLQGLLETRVGAYAEGGDKWPLLVARVGIAPWGPLDYSEDVARTAGSTRVAMGINGTYDKRTSETTSVDPASGAMVTGSGPDERRVAGGVDLALCAGRLSAFAEAYVDQQKAKGNDGLVRAGGFAQVGYFLVPETLELAGRFNLLAADTHAAGADGLRRYEVGLSHYVIGSALRVQGRYSYDQVVGANTLPWVEAHQADVQFVLAL